jgi:hypothetical protein
MVKLDLGAGENKKDGFIGVDIRPFEGIDVVANLGRDPWPWENESVDEVHCAHMLEHLTGPQRIHFANELYRVLKPEAKAAIITPHFGSIRAYGDLTHQWPPVVSFWYLYLNAKWRKENAPHVVEYSCDFDHGYGFSLHPVIQLKNQEYQNYAVVHLLEGAQDLYVTLTKR